MILELEEWRARRSRQAEYDYREMLQKLTAKQLEQLKAVEEAQAAQAEKEEQERLNKEKQYE